MAVFVFSTQAILVINKPQVKTGVSLFMVQAAHYKHDSEKASEKAVSNLNLLNVWSGLNKR